MILSGDKNLIAIFQKGEDVHSSMAAKVFKVKPVEVTPEMRRKIKVINFGVLYGMGINALRQNLGGTREEAQKFYEEYFKNFSGVKEYIEKTKKFARENGWTETLFGRRRYFPEIASNLEYVKKKRREWRSICRYKRTSADFIKLAMVRADKALAEAGLKDYARMLLQIHDELLFEIKEELIAKVAPIIKDAMESVYPLKSKEEKELLAEQFKKKPISPDPLVVNVETGDYWEEMFPSVKVKNKIMFYLLYGQDTYRSREKLNELLESF